MDRESLGRWGLLTLFGGSVLLQIGGCAPLIGDTLVRIALDLVFIPLNDAVQAALASLLGG